MRSAFRSFAVLCGAVLCASAALAQPYPNKPIKAIVPFAAGSATDQIGRAFAAKMSETLGQVIVIENKAGVNGMLGADAVAKAAPDGYTILIGTNSTKPLFSRLKPFEFVTNECERFRRAGISPEILNVVTHRAFETEEIEGRGALNLGPGFARLQDRTKRSPALDQPTAAVECHDKLLGNQSGPPRQLGREFFGQDGLVVVPAQLRATCEIGGQLHVVALATVDLDRTHDHLRVEPGVVLGFEDIAILPGFQTFLDDGGVIRRVDDGCGHAMRDGVASGLGFPLVGLRPGAVLSVTLIRLDLSEGRHRCRSSRCGASGAPSRKTPLRLPSKVRAVAFCDSRKKFRDLDLGNREIIC